MMRLIPIICTAIWLTLCLAGPADAGPIVGAIGWVIGAVQGFAASSVFAGFLVRTVLSIGLSALAKALGPKQRQPGLKTDVTTSGGTTPQKFIVGFYATGGQLIAPPMSYGSAGDTPRAYLVYAIALSSVPGVTLQRVVINDEYVTLGAPAANWGKPVTGNLNGYAWIDFKDGSQTAVHADLLAAFAADPDRPWSADMVGPGTAYAVARFKYNRERFNGLPSVRFEMLGIPLYDPRADSTAGGSGAQRWANPATWAQSSNPVVIAYNILRGIKLPSGDVWGGECAAEDLPFANWAAAMNECDVLVTASGGGTEAQYRCGFEIGVDDEPASVIEELLKTCSGQMVEVGGVWKIKVGAPSMPVLFFSDDDVIVTAENEYDPFPGLSATYNAITASYPEPASLWETKEAPARYDSALEVLDGNRRLPADLQLPALPYAGQVQRIMATYIKDERRFRRHRLTLPPEAAILEPLDTVSWTSSRNGYAAKTFEVTGLNDSLMTLLQAVNLRERDPADYSWSSGSYLPSSPPSSTTTPPAAQAVPGWAVAPASLADSDGAARVPAILISWTPSGAEDATGLEWQIRKTGTTTTDLTGTIQAFNAGFTVIPNGVITGQAYEVRGRLIVDRAVNWTGWTAVTVPLILIETDDIAPGAVTDDLIGSVSASKITAGQMSVRYLYVDQLLQLDAASAGLGMGKASLVDTHDGLYLGRSALPGGGTGFGFHVGFNDGSVTRSMLASSTALRLTNAEFMTDTALAPAMTSVTTSQTVVLPAGSKLLNLELLGAGGGGRAYASGASPAATAGGNTVVQLYDGATYTGISWTSNGAAPAAYAGGRGQSSAQGVGGTPGSATMYHGTPESFTPGGNASGYGAGGGGFTLGGVAANLVSVGTYDISALADPRLVITIGAAGTGQGSGSSRGGNGAPGLVRYAVGSTVPVRASVVPRAPTAWGTFTKPASATGNTHFPDLGPGIWLISADGLSNLEIGYVEVSTGATTAYLYYGSSALFVASQRPNIISGGSATSRTIRYQFWALT